MAAPSKAKSHAADKIELGFIEESDSNSLLSHQFPSKVGGLPAWLSLKPLPSYEQLKCAKCSDPSVFLLQVYAPRDDSELTFHRTLFIFVCRNPACCVNNTNSNFKVFRSQLAKSNDFYSSEPPVEGVIVDPEAHPHAGKLQPLCVICGARGPKSCGRCHKTSYCCKQHQTIDWKAIHKTVCHDSDGKALDAGEGTMSFKHPNVLFPEYDLVTEPEKYVEGKEKSEEEKMKEYKAFLTSEAATPMDDNLDTKELDKMASKISEDDDQFLTFKERLRHDQEQVLRFDRGGEPLWISALNKPTEIPSCPCGAERQFEFQVLPQILIDLNVDSLEHSIDWGVLCIYTCMNSCDIRNKYQEEYLWKQDIVKLS